MKNFIEKLLKEYGDTAENLSISGKKFIVNNKTKMIGLDEMAKQLSHYTPKFKERFSSSDALYVVFDEDNFKFYFIEFKNIDYTDVKERLEDKYKLKELINNIDDDDFKKELKKYLNKLVDKSFMRFKMKPYDSLSLIYYYMNIFFNESNDELTKSLFEIEKYYILVSRTKTEVNPLFKNKSNRNNNIIRPLRFLKRLIPYYYNNVLIIPNTKFNKLMRNIKNQ